VRGASDHPGWYPAETPTGCAGDRLGRGRVGAVAFDSLVIEVGGIGIACSRAGDPLDRPAGHDDQAPHLPPRQEDQQSLFGFRTTEDLGFFNLLLTVTGVGPKVALAIVGSRPTPDLQLAIMAQDQAVLVSIPGIGKKLADRIIFELKEKVAAAGIAASTLAGSGIGASESEVVGALQALGYSLAEAREASRIALADTKIGGTLEDRVKAALRSLLRD